MRFGDIELTQQAYLCKITETYIYYEALAKDKVENEYIVTWRFNRKSHDLITQDGDCGSLDWENPYAIDKI
jgi:hypothetical protein